MQWNKFSQETHFEQLIFDLSKACISLVLTSDLPEKSFSAFAFNCSSYSGDISLSFGVNPGYEDERKQHRFYPPDWEYEVMQGAVSEVGELWDSRYQPVQSAYALLQESEHNERELEDFAGGFLASLRRVMVRLEREGCLRGLSSMPVWTLVTEVDADTGEEERLLQQARENKRVGEKE